MSSRVGGIPLDRAEFDSYRKEAVEKKEEPAKKLNELDKRLNELDKRLDDVAKRIDELNKSQFPLSADWCNRIILFGQICAVVTVLTLAAYLINPTAVATVAKSFFSWIGNI